MGNISDRLNSLVEELADGKHTVFAKKCGITPTTFQNYINGRAPNAESLIRICETFDVDITWILTGKGYKFLEDVSEKKVANGEGSQPSDSNIVDLEHIDTIKQFKDKPRAKRANDDLVVIEVIDRDTFIDTVGYISGVRKSLENRAGGSVTGEAPAGDAGKKKRANGQ